MKSTLYFALPLFLVVSALCLYQRDDMTDIEADLGPTMFSQPQLESLSFSLAKRRGNSQPPKSGPLLTKSHSQQRNSGLVRAPASIAKIKQDFVCKASRWDLSRKLYASQLHQVFKDIPREKLIQNLWFELTKRPKRNLTLQMLQYLIETEQPGQTKTYFKVLGHIAYNTKQPIYKIFSKYKNRRLKLKAKNLRLLDACDLYMKARLAKS